MGLFDLNNRLIPIYVLINLAYVFANVWIGCSFFIHKSEIEVLADVLYHGIALSSVNMVMSTIPRNFEPPTEGVFHCVLCHKGTNISMWDFLALALHCAFLTLCLLERMVWKGLFSLFLICLFPLRVTLQLLLEYFHKKKVKSEASKRQLSLSAVL